MLVCMRLFMLHSTDLNVTAGGYVNHNFFWNIMTPEGLGLTTTDNLMLAIKEKYAKFELFKQQFETQALSVFGSGWAWLVCDPATVRSLYRLFKEICSQ